MLELAFLDTEKTQPDCLTPPTISEARTWTQVFSFFGSWPFHDAELISSIPVHPTQEALLGTYWHKQPMKWAGDSEVNVVPAPLPPTSSLRGGRPLRSCAGTIVKPAKWLWSISRARWGFRAFWVILARLWYLVFNQTLIWMLLGRYFVDMVNTVHQLTINPGDHPWQWGWALTQSVEGLLSQNWGFPEKKCCVMSVALTPACLSALWILDLRALPQLYEPIP